jgi:GntR family transcriptional regulator
MSAASDYLEVPLLTSPGQPLRVAVYDRISHGIRSGVLGAGELLPRETELGVSLGVSRTVVREALMLLEEDGLIVTRRGIGRFVAETLPHDGADDFRPLEQLFADGGELTVERVEFSLQRVTDFVAEHLGLPDGADFWFRESIVRRDGQPIALVQEYLPDERRLRRISAPVADALSTAAEDASTLLHALTERVGPVFRAGSGRVAANVAGPTRASQLGVKASDPLLVLTQPADIDGTPAYVAKVALPPAFGHLMVPAWAPSGS